MNEPRFEVGDYVWIKEQLFQSGKEGRSMSYKIPRVIHGGRRMIVETHVISTAPNNWTTYYVVRGDGRSDLARISEHEVCNEEEAGTILKVVEAAFQTETVAGMEGTPSASSNW